MAGSLRASLTARRSSSVSSSSSTGAASSLAATGSWARRSKIAAAGNDSSGKASTSSCSSVLVIGINGTTGVHGSGKRESPQFEPLVADEWLKCAQSPVIRAYRALSATRGLLLNYLQI